jgi:hypothetical protein
MSLPLGRGWITSWICLLNDRPQHQEVRLFNAFAELGSQAIKKALQCRA